MAQSTLSIPVPTTLFLAVTEKLKSQGRELDPVSHIVSLIEGWILQSPSPPPTEVVELDSPAADDGYWWKSVYIPEGSIARMTYKGRRYQATVSSRGFEFEGRVLTPSEFTFLVTNTTRNAWRDIELKFPADSKWVPAEVYRSSYPK